MPKEQYKTIEELKKMNEEALNMEEARILQLQTTHLMNPLTGKWYTKDEIKERHLEAKKEELDKAACDVAIVKFSYIEKKAKAEKTIENDFFAYAAGRSNKKELEQRRLDDKQAIRDMALRYGVLAENDPELKKITDKLKELGEINVNTEHGYWHEGKIYQETADKARENLDKLIQEEEQLHQEYEAKFNNPLFGQDSKENILENGLEEIEKELAAKMDANEEKQRIYADIIGYMEAQMDGRLIMESQQAIDQESKKTNAEKAFYYIDGTNMTFDRIDHSESKGTQAIMWATRTHVDASDMPLFPHEPTGNDVRQGGLGDCYFVQGLSTMARLHPDYLKECIRENPDGKTVTVRLNSKSKDGVFKPVYVKVDKVVPGFGISSFAPLTQGGENCLWVNCFERALAVSGLWACCSNTDNAYYEPVPSDIQDRYARLKEMEANSELNSADTLKNEIKANPWLFKNGKLIQYPSADSITAGESGPALEILYGEKFRSMEIQIPDMNKTPAIDDTKAPDYNEDELNFFHLIQEGMANNLPMSTGSKDESQQPRVIESHAYSVLGARKDEITGRILIKLRNPMDNGNVLASSGLVLQTTYNPDGTRTYESVNGKHGIFEIELKDYEHDFDDFHINGYEQIQKQLKFTDAMRSYLPDDDSVFHDPKKLLNFFLQTALHDKYKLPITEPFRSADDFAEKALPEDAVIKGIQKRQKDDPKPEEEYQKKLHDQEEKSRKMLKVYYSYWEKTITDAFAGDKNKPLSMVFAKLADAKDAVRDRLSDMALEAGYTKEDIMLGNNIPTFMKNPMDNVIDKLILQSVRVKEPMTCRAREEAFENLKEEMKKMGPGIKIQLSEKTNPTHYTRKNEVILDALYRRKEDGLAMASVTINHKQKTIPFQALVEQYDHVQFTDGLDHTIAPKPIEKQETPAFENGSLDYRTGMTYLKAFDDAYDRLKKTESWHSSDSPEFKALKESLAQTRVRLVKMTGKPLSLFQSAVSDLSGDIYRYYLHTQDQPKTGTTRAQRLEILETLKQIAVNAAEQQIDPLTECDHNNDYVKYSESAKAIRAQRAVEEKQAEAMAELRDLMKGNDRNPVIDKCSQIMYLQNLKESAQKLGEEAVMECMDQFLMEDAVKRLHSATKTIIMNNDIHVTSKMTGAQLGSILTKAFPKDYKMIDVEDIAKKNGIQTKKDKEKTNAKVQSNLINK